jgi:hypothetical protein
MSEGKFYNLTVEETVSNLKTDLKQGLKETDVKVYIMIYLNLKEKNITIWLQ